MFTTPLPDGGAGLAVFHLIIGAWAWAISAVIIEAIMFAIMLQVNVIGAAGLSIAVNTITTIIGYVYATLPDRPLDVFFRGDWSPSTNFWLEIAALFVVTILVEGFLLIGMKPKAPKPDIWATSFWANSVSYFVGILIMLSLKAPPGA